MPRIRSARPEDASALAAIYAPFVTDTVVSFEEVPPDAAEMARRMAQLMPDYPYLVAEEEGQVLGYAYASPHRSRSAYRFSCDVTIYLHPKARGAGLGRKLYDHLLKALKNSGFHRAYAGIALPNPASIALHEACGFAHIGTYHEVGQKFGTWHDVGWWECDLSAWTPFEA